MTHEAQYDWPFYSLSFQTLIINDLLAKIPPFGSKKRKKYALVQEIFLRKENAKIAKFEESFMYSNVIFDYFGPFLTYSRTLILSSVQGRDGQ